MNETIKYFIRYIYYMRSFFGEEAININRMGYSVSFALFAFIQKKK